MKLKSVQNLHSSIGILGTDHGYESESTGLAGVWIKHDLYLLDLYNSELINSTHARETTNNDTLNKHIEPPGGYVNSGNHQMADVPCA